MDEKNELALFRFSLIAPLVREATNQSQKKYLEEVCAKSFDVPGLGQREFSPSTLKLWLYNYRRYGLEGLKTNQRSDKGKFRTLSTDIQNMIKTIIKENPERTGTNIYDDLLDAKLKNLPSLSTVQRFISQQKNELVEPTIERKRFEFEFANDCWQSDVCVGPYLTINGKKKKTYLIAFLDDATRLVVNSQYFFNESYLSLEETLRIALLKRGVPKKIFVDNGKIYYSKQLRLICARLGIALSYARAYSPQSKGKIERMFRTYRDGFLREIDLEEIDSLDKLNELSNSYIEKEYHQRVHSSLNGLSPIERFLKDKDKIKMVTGEQLDKIFLHQVKRKVTNDATVSIHNNVFEVPQKFCKRQVDVLFKPNDFSLAYLKFENEPLISIFPLNSIDNSKIPRKQYQKDTIDYTKLYEKGDEN